MKRFWLASLAAVFLVPVLPAWCTPGDAAAVLTHCGTPDADTNSTSEVDGLPQRTLTYGKFRLNFQQTQGLVDGSWSFTTAWDGHIPVSARIVANQLPCFRDGLDEANVRYQNALTQADPAIAQQSTVNSPAHGAFGISHLWLIVLLAAVIGIFAVMIPRRRKMVRGPEVAARPFRRPSLNMIRGRRRPRVLPGPNQP